jgi:hypothetical protein
MRRAGYLIARARSRGDLSGAIIPSYAPRRVVPWGAMSVLLQGNRESA